MSHRVSGLNSAKICRHSPQGVGTRPSAVSAATAMALNERVPSDTAFTRAVPLGRLGRPDDLPGAILFLSSDDAAFITGQVISVSGGLTMHG